MSPSRSTPITSPIRGPSSRRTPRVSRRSSHPISITDLRYVLNSENDEKDTLHIVLSAGGRLHVVRQEPLRRCAARTPCDGRVSRGVRRLSARRRRGETLRPQYGQCLYRPDRCAGPRRVPRRCRALPSLGARPARRFGGIQRYDRAGRPCRRGQGSRRGAEIFQAGYDPHQGDLLGRLHAGSAGDGDLCRRQIYHPAQQRFRNLLPRRAVPGDGRPLQLAGRQSLDEHRPFGQHRFP